MGPRIDQWVKTARRLVSTAGDGHDTLASSKSVLSFAGAGTAPDQLDPFQKSVSAAVPDAEMTSPTAQQTVVEAQLMLPRVCRVAPLSFGTLVTAHTEPFHCSART